MSSATLGVVIPVYNEVAWIARSVAALHASAARADWALDVVAVDDGSSDGTADVLDGLASDGLLRVVHQPNGGRFAARLAGLAALGTEQVLLLDARVLVDRESLTFVRHALEQDPTARVWNGHVQVMSAGNPYGAFWSGITKVGWRAYFAHPRQVRFGLDDFNAYPKGTTMFLAPRDLVVLATASFSSMFADVRLASDDTRMLREVARVEEICLAPGFSCQYFGRDTFAKWARQAYFRGTTFVDGYLGHARRADAGLAAVAAVAATAAVVLVRRPRWAVGSAAAGVLAAAGLTRASGGTGHESWSVTRLVLPFGAIFGAGLVRGLLLARRPSDRNA